MALSGVKKTETDPSVFNFYVYLRTHPLITRHAIANNAQKKMGGAAIMLTGFRGAKSIDMVSVLSRNLTRGGFHYKSWA